MNSQLVSFVECVHKVSKHSGGITVNLSIHINPGTVVSESCIKMLQ